MKIIKTVSNQTIYDIAVKHYGNVEAVAELIGNNLALRNDPEAVAAIGVDYIADTAFYPDVALLEGQDVRIDTESNTLKQTVTRDVKNREINTFDL